MKSFLCILLTSLIWYTSGTKDFFYGRRVGGNLPPPDNVPISRAITTKYFDQILDHFDPTNQQTFKQKYFVNEEFSNKETRNVAFLFIGGESPASLSWMSSGSWINSATEYNALCFMLEHRYYGESQPFNELTTKNLKYLTSQQAIDDLATFIVAMNKEYALAKDVKWIVFGGSYAGSLAAWLRQKYPHLVQGAVASSGPLLAIVDFKEYMKVVADDLVNLHSQNCANTVQTAFQQLENNLGNSTIDSLFKFCTPSSNSLNNTMDIANLFEAIAYGFASIAQYNSPRTAVTINYLCDLMTKNSSQTELEKLAVVSKIWYGNSCIDYLHVNNVKYLQNSILTGAAVSSGMRQWMYQTCTEFAFYQTSTQNTPVFGTRFPIETFVQLCADVYGSEIDAAYLDRVVARTNRIYGGYNIKHTNVVHVHGSVDPWHPLGIYETTDESVSAILINGTSHCYDMYGTHISDSVELTSVRKIVHDLIGSWLTEQPDPEHDTANILNVNKSFICSVLLITLLFQVVNF